MNLTNPMGTLCNHHLKNLRRTLRVYCYLHCNKESTDTPIHHWLQKQRHVLCLKFHVRHDQIRCYRIKTHTSSTSMRLLWCNNYYINVIITWWYTVVSMTTKKAPVNRIVSSKALSIKFSTHECVNYDLTEDFLLGTSDFHKTVSCVRSTSESGWFTSPMGSLRLKRS